MVEYCINRSDALGAINRKMSDFYDYPQSIEPVDAPTTEKDEFLSKVFVAVIRAVSALEPKEFRTGEWQKDGIFKKCSCCSKKSIRKQPYCPNCGARMDGE